MLINLPEVVLKKIGKKLAAKDLFNLSFTHPGLRDFFDNDYYWKKLMQQEMWFESRFFRYQDDAHFLLNNVPNQLQGSESLDQKIIRFVMYSHDGTMMALFANGCRLWVYRGNEEILHVYLSRKRTWNKIHSVEFSPDDQHLLVTGLKESLMAPQSGNEVLIYKLNEDHATLRSFINIDFRMMSTWFDEKHVMFTQDSGTRNRMRLFISSIDQTADILVYPILTFDTRITGITVAQHVSPRTRKITQIADEAQEEGKTLNQKLIEIGMESGVDVTNMSELRAILDQESQCMPCYRLHSHHDAVSSKECRCECHHNTDKLLIFHGNDDRVHVKVVTERILERARAAFIVRSEDMEHDPNQIRLFSVLPLCTQFDTVDHVFKIGVSLAKSAMCFSPDHRYLYITGTRKASNPNNSFLEVKPTCLDLETMVVKTLPDFKAVSWMEYEYPIRMTANNDFLAIYSGHEVIIWSSFHRGSPVAILSLYPTPVSSVALHPLTNLLAVSNEKLIHYYQSPLMKREECASSGGT